MTATTTMATSFLDELSWRGLLYQQTDGLGELLARGQLTAYCGFDPTANSLHLGHLVPVMGLLHLQRAGHRPIALVGGGTALIGDPSGRSTERPLASVEEIAANAEGLRAQLAHFLDFEGPSAARMMNNAEWLTRLGAVEFMRDVGKHFTVNYMLAKESVKARMEEGISYTEFSYMLLQSYDFLELHRRAGCALQIGGSDQWGNITAGIELIRRTTGGTAHALTMPLVTSASGVKFGKSAGGAVWLDPARTSPYKFFQYWINTDDRDVGRYLRYFTLLSREEIEALEAELAANPARRAPQRALARDVTARVHGAESARIAEEASALLFAREFDPSTVSAAVLESLRGEIPYVELPAPRAQGAPGDALDTAELFAAAKLAPSKGAARRLLEQGGLSANGRKLTIDDRTLPLSSALAGGYFLLRKGARDYALVRVTA